MLERSARLASEAELAFSRAARTGDQSAIARARSLFSDAQGAAKQAETQAARVRGSQLELESARALDSVISKQIAAEQSLVRLQERRKIEAGDRLKSEQRVVDELKRQADIVSDNISLFDDGTPRTQRDIEERSGQRIQP